MFKGCLELENAPVISATTFTGNYGMREMFIGCSSLNNIKVAFTEWPDSLSGTQNWLSGVSSTGTFIKPTSLPEIYDESHIPVGWNVINY